MSVGDIMLVSFDGDSAQINFDGVDKSTEFLLILGSASSTSAGSSIVMSNESVPVEDADPLIKNMLSEGDGYDASSILSSWLRAAEFELATQPPTQITTPTHGIGKTMTKAVELGSYRGFRVLSSLTSLTAYSDVNAYLRCIESDILIYIDEEVNSNMLSSDDIALLCSEYQRAAEWENQIYDGPSDIDGNGKVIALITTQVNRLGNMAGGIITGFFYAADLYEQSDANPTSDYGEIVYLMSPDPDGDFGYPISNEFAMSNLLPAVFPHELQHAISYNQHVFVRDGSPEEGWLNEGMSHLTEDMIGHNQENPSRYELFLADPANTMLVSGESPSLQERGAAYLFLRFMYEQSADPDQFLSRLLQTNESGVDNLESAFNGSDSFNNFSEFMLRWTIALAMTDRGLTSDSRFVYQPRTVDSNTGNTTGVCLICEPEDGRDTVLTGPYLNSYSAGSRATVSGSAAKYYLIDTIPDSINLSATTSNNTYGLLMRSK